MSFERGDSRTDDITMRTLRRMDPNILSIVKSASAVAIYKFSAEKDKWIKNEIEGPLHVVSRSIPPHSCFFVLNRLSTENLVEYITKETDVEIEKPYLLFKSKRNQIYCIWFYDNKECEETGNLLLKKLSSLSLPTPTASCANALEDTLAELGLNINSSKRITTPNSVKPSPVIKVSEKKKENGGRPVNLKDLFASFQDNSNDTKNIKKQSDFRTNEDNEEMLTPAMIEGKLKYRDNKITASLSSPISEDLLISPRGFSQISHSTPVTKPIKENISLEHLRNSLLHLIQNDDEFVRRIYDTYVLTYP